MADEAPQPAEQPAASINPQDLLDAVTDQRNDGFNMLAMATARTKSLERELAAAYERIKGLEEQIVKPTAEADKE